MSKQLVYYFIIYEAVLDAQKDDIVLSTKSFMKSYIKVFHGQLLYPLQVYYWEILGKLLEIIVPE